MHIVFAFITIIPHHIPHSSRESKQDYQLNSASLHGDEVKLCTAAYSIADEIYGYGQGSVEAQKSCNDALKMFCKIENFQLFEKIIFHLS